MSEPTANQAAPPPHLLSFDVEEYFQVEAARAAGISPGQWDSIEPRLAPAVDRVLSLLAEFGTRATFFVLGWVARNQEAVVRRIAEAGHEVASHGGDHQMLTRQTPEEFRRDLLDARKVLEDLTGAGVVGYRAPTFSITHRTAWALDVLAEANFAYDSSIFPIRHDRYGVPDAPRWPHRAIGPGGGAILEIPPLTLRVGGCNLPAAGGGYLRLLPLWVSACALSRAERAGRSGMVYLHPWELDPDQPVLPLGRLRNWRHRVGLAQAEQKLRRLLQRFRFTDVRSWLDATGTGDLAAYAYGRTRGATPSMC